ncbi:MAG: signal peptidase II [Pirellulaceae bacterium]|nr:signal peptidase II [Pirellulaceae bacterium]
MLSLVAAIGILGWLFIAGAAEDLLLTISLGSVMGGIIGNLYDRLGWWHAADVFAGHQYGVRDWILLTYQNRYHWPNFNIADSLLMLGAGLLMWHAYTQTEPSGQPESSESTTK